MPSPTTPVLDNFNRANESPLSGGGNWGFGGLLDQLRLVSNEAAGGAGSSSSISRWNPTVFAADQEAYLTRSVIGTDMFSDFGVVCRHTNTATQYTGYLGSVTQPAPSTPSRSLLPILGVGGANTFLYQGFARISVIVNSVHVRIEQSPMTLVAGGRVWLSCVGSQIVLYIDNGGGFTPVITMTDTNIPGGGRLALYAQATSSRADEFGGGNV